MNETQKKIKIILQLFAPIFYSDRQANDCEWQDITKEIINIVNEDKDNAKDNK